MDKNFLKSKSIWGGFLIIFSAFYGYFTGDTAGSTAIQLTGLGLFGIGIRDAFPK